MRRARRRWRSAAVLCVVAAGWTAAGASTATADSGSITDVRDVGGGQWTATYTSSSTYCSSSGYCGWYPYATQVGPNEPCNPYDTEGRLTYVGEIQEDSAPQTGSDTFYPKTMPFKLCLHINQAADRRITVAEGVFGTSSPPPSSPPPSPPQTPPPASPGPSPSPQPTQGASPPPFLTLTAAKTTIRRIIRRETRREPHGIAYRCRRVDDASFDCSPSWFDRYYHYVIDLYLEDEGETIAYEATNGLRASRRCFRKTRSVRRCGQRVRW